MLRQAMDWGELVTALPRVGGLLLEQAERGELFHLHLKDGEQISHRLDRLGSRLALSILVAALIIGLAILLASATNDDLRGWLRLGGLVCVGGLGVWQLHSIRRAGD